MDKGEIMNEYQKSAADKARAFLTELERVVEVDSSFKRVIVSMRPSINKIIHGEESLPTKILDGWDIYFLPRDNFMEVLNVYPDLVNRNIELTGLLRHTDMESYLKWRKYLESCSCYMPQA